MEKKYSEILIQSLPIREKIPFLYIVEVMNTFPHFKTTRCINEQFLKRIESTQDSSEKSSTQENSPLPYTVNYHPPNEMNDTTFDINKEIKKEADPCDTLDNSAVDTLNNSIDSSGVDSMDDSKMMLECKQEHEEQEKLAQIQYPFMRAAIEADALLTNVRNDSAFNSKGRKKAGKHRGRPKGKKKEIQASKRKIESNTTSQHKKRRSVLEQIELSLKRGDSDVSCSNDKHVDNDDILNEDNEEEMEDVDNDKDEDYKPEKHIGFLPNEKYMKPVTDTKDFRERNVRKHGKRGKDGRWAKGTCINRGYQPEGSNSETAINSEDGDGDHSGQDEEEPPFKKPGVCVVPYSLL